MSAFTLLLLTPLVSPSPYFYHSYQAPLYRTYNPTFYSSNLRSIQVPFNLGYLTRFGLSPSDLIQETRAQAESIKTTIRFLASNPASAQYLNRVITDSNNVCLNSVEDIIASVEDGTKIIENAGPEIKQLIKTVQAFEKLTDTPAVVRESANILRLLEVLMPKLAPARLLVCGASNGQAFGSLLSLGALVDELSSSNNFYLTQQVRQELKKSGKIISEVTPYLTQLNKSFAKLNQFCTSDKEYNIESIAAIGEMMTGLANIFVVFGGQSDAEQIRKQGEFMDKVVANINKLGDLDLGSLDCSSPGSFKVAAQTLEDIASLIEEVGIEKLCQQLGLSQTDCTF